MSIIWRPILFSALGAEFQSDPTVNDGIHLRWMIDPRMGLPFHNKDREWGEFQVFEQTSKFPSLATANLTEIKSVTSIPVHSAADIGSDSYLEHIQDQYYFIRNIAEPANLAAEELLNQLRMMHQWRITRQQRPFISYVKGVAKIIKGETVHSQPFSQRAEVVAVDMKFSVGIGTVPGGDGSTNTGCLGIFSALAEKKYLSVRAFDKNGQLLMEDWVGIYAFKAEYMSNPSARNKFSISLRAPGIHHIQIVTEPGRPNMKTDNFQWIFCEEYCNANVWKSVDEPVRFEANKESYDEILLKEKYYEPFKKTLNWSDALNTLVNEVLSTSEVQNLFGAADTFAMYSNTITMNDNAPAPGAENSLASMPALPVLLHAAMDPAVASLLALYQHKKEQSSPRDIRIVAKAPFFHPANLELLYERMKRVCEQNDTAFLLEEFLGWYSVIKKIWIDLGALVLALPVGIKPAPPTPAPFTTTVTSVDLPLEEPGRSTLLVDSILKIPKPAFSLLPYLTVQAFEIERSIGGADLENPAADKISNALEKLGILPPVFVPTVRWYESFFIVRDNFSLSVPPEETVRYRARAYDLFARPGGWTEGTTENIPVPCYPPETPGNLSANPFVQNNQLWVELYITVSGATRDFQAIANDLEISLHVINDDEAGAMSSIRWTGDRMARGMTLNFDSTHFPDPATQQQSCLNLNWNIDKLSWNNALPGVCDPTYPLENAIVEIFDDPTSAAIITDVKTYRVKMAVATIASLSEGDHRWCSRVRSKGTCAQGDTIYSLESCSGFNYRKVLPPPDPIQPSSSIIPESTFPDKKGNSFYNIPLNSLLPAVPSGEDGYLLNFYSIPLEKLQADISTLVNGKTLLAGAEAIVWQLARANRSRYKKLNVDPIKVQTEPVHYPVAVDGNVETYHVVGVVGTNAELMESPWSHATIMIFKTPQAVPKPKLRFTSIKSRMEADKIVANISFRAAFDTEVTSAIPIPRIQLLRHDLSTGKTRFVGEIDGAWNGAGTDKYYEFSFEDQKLNSWRHYNYEAVLLSSSEGKWVKSDIRADGDTLAPGLKTSIPLNNDTTLPPIIDSTGTTLQFDFLIGDFDFSITRTNADGTQQRFNGKIKNYEVIGLTGASLTILPLEEKYRLSWTDTAAIGVSYTLRLFRGQGMPWTNKISIP